MKSDPRVDAYIAKAGAFARPLLLEMRRRIQRTVPDANETIKWNVPFYELNGKLLASMAAFKQHAKFGVWQDMKPSMVDAATLAELPSASDYEKQLKAAAAHARAAASPTKRPAKTAGKKTPKTRAAKKK